MWHCGWKNKIKFSFLSSSGYPHSYRKGNPVTDPIENLPHLFSKVLGWAYLLERFPPKGPVHRPNKKCHFVCLAPGFLRANRATNTSCCLVTSNCHPPHLRNANHARPSADLSFPCYTGEQVIWTSAFLSAATSATVSWRGEKPNR